MSNHSNSTNIKKGREADSINWVGVLGYFFLGIYFGVVLTKSEVISWFRIQEMFRFEAVHMYGIIGSAIVVGFLSIQAIKRFNLKTINGDDIEIPDKEWSHYRYWIGGILFGFGWALLGACPGPIYALIGAGYPVFLVALVSAIFGAWLYGVLRPHLPH
jgi:uncharacterized membrane protein YedE/YeeE